MWAGFRFAWETFVEYAKAIRWTWIWRAFLFLLGESWWRRCLFLIGAYLGTLFVVRGIGFPITFWDVAELFLLGALGTGIFWPELLVQGLYPENEPLTVTPKVPWINKDPWFSWTIENPHLVLTRLTWACALVLGSVLIQQVETRRWQIFGLIIVLTVGAILSWRWNRTVSTKLWKAIPQIVLMVYLIPTLMMRYVEIEVRHITRREDLLCYHIQSNSGAETDKEFGETFQNSNDPTWGKYQADDMAGVLAKAQEKHHKVGCWVTGIYLPSFGWYRNILWTHVIDHAPEPEVPKTQ